MSWDLEDLAVITGAFGVIGPPPWPRPRLADLGLCYGAVIIKGFAFYLCEMGNWTVLFST